MNSRPTTMLDEWMHPNPNPSPRTLMATFLNDNFTPDEGPASSEEDAQSKEEARSLPHVHVQRQPGSNGGGLAERMAARAGFNVPKLNTSRVSPVANLVMSVLEVQKCKSSTASRSSRRDLEPSWRRYRQ